MSKNSDEILRVLVIMPALNICGGMESFIMNYFRNIDRNKIIFDFITHDISDNSYEKEIIELGGQIYKLPPFSFGTLKNIRSLYKEILIKNKYKIVHCNMANAAFIYLKIAEDLKVPVRILHSHQDKAADTFSHVLRNIPLIVLGKKYANVNLACSKQAGDYLFKDKKYYIVNNAIDYDKYKYNEEIRSKVRKELKLENSFVIGNTGRLCLQKNQSFLIEVFSAIVNIKNNAVLMIVGEGEKHAELRELTESKGISDKVLFLGSRNDIDELLQAMDVFVFPSIYEGLGISLLEAQAASLKAFCSDTIPKAANISNELIYISLEKSYEEWAKIILTNSDKILRSTDLSLNKDYDIKSEAIKLSELYSEVLNRENYL